MWDEKKLRKKYVFDLKVQKNKNTNIFYLIK